MIYALPAVSIGTQIITQSLHVPPIDAWPTREEVRVSNRSPNPVNVHIGNDIHWLEELCADVYCLRGAPQITIEPVVVATAAPTSQLSSILFTVGDTVGAIPGTYPAPVATASPLLGGQQLLDHFHVATGTLKSASYIVPLGTRAIVVVINNPPNVAQLTVAGHTTVVNYLALSNVTNNVNTTHFLASADAQLDLTANANLSGAFDAWVAAILDGSGWS